MGTKYQCVGADKNLTFENNQEKILNCYLTTRIKKMKFTAELFRLGDCLSRWYIAG